LGEATIDMENVKEEIKVSIKARYPLVYLVTWEEKRAEALLQEAARELGKVIYFWSCSSGFEDKEVRLAEAEQPLVALDYVERSPERAIFVFRDLHPFLNDFKVVRKLRDLVFGLRRSYKTVVLLSPVLKIPTELEKDVTVFDLPLPTVEDLTELLRKFLDSSARHPQLNICCDDDLIERVVKATLGLTEAEARDVYAKAIVRDRAFSEADLPRIIGEKKQIIRKSGVLEYYDLSETMDNVGGLSELKNWLANRLEAFTERARQYGLPQPKGLLLIGVQGCGKSLSAKAIASLWKLPLLRLDIGAVFNPFIGASEENMRKAIAVAESISPCVLWLDEIEKGFTGSMGGIADSGVSARVFATFLIWLQEKTTPVFVIATANSIWALPPEMLRKGRFDEIFFIDLPSREERRHIFQIHLQKRQRRSDAFDIDKLSHLTVRFSGAEIEQIIIEAMYETFPQNREVTTEDIVGAIGRTVPLSVTMSEEIEKLRDWARHRARLASGGLFEEEGVAARPR